MSEFYGTIKGNRGEATRCGTKKSGITTYCASWNGAVRCRAYRNGNGKNYIKVELVKWQGKGKERLIYEGEI